MMTQFEEIKLLLGESSTYYLIAVGMDANYTYINKRYAEMFESIHGDILGKHYALTIHTDDQKTCENVSALAFANPEQIFPATLRKHDGKGGYIITRWEYKAMFDQEGNPEGIFCIGHDITELIQISGELQRSKYSHSHVVRKHVANLMGLGRLISEANELSSIQHISEMMEHSLTELDVVIKDFYK